MLENKDIPSIVQKAIEPYEKGKKQIQFIQVKVYSEGHYYYCFTLTPPIEYLAVREDGTVPLYDKAKEINYSAAVFNSAEKNIKSIGTRWLNSSIEVLYRYLLNLLNQVNDIYKNDISSEVQKAIDTLVDITEANIQDHLLLKEKVNEEYDFMEEINEREVLTKDDENLLRQYILEIAKAANQQSVRQLETVDERKRVLSFLSNKMWFQPRKLFFYLRFRTYTKDMASQKDSKDVLEVKDSIEAGMSPEDKENKQDILNSILNPKR